ncbi:MAG: AbrB/MazE/SpoVT family DNA-binding domain-containing protein [Snowella sp.]
MKSFAIRLEKNGTITVPQAIQDKLNLCEGDLFNLIEIEDLILLTLQQLKQATWNKQNGEFGSIILFLN